jgi:hypothetical protein
MPVGLARGSRLDFAKVLAEIGRFLDARGARYGLAGARTRVLPGMEMLAPSAEHLAAMKVHAMRSDPARTLKEMADIQFLLGIPGIDEAEIRRYFERAGLPERLDEIKALAGHRDPHNGG